LRRPEFAQGGGHVLTRGNAAAVAIALNRRLEEHAVAARDRTAAATLGLLPALSHTYRVALDDLVAPPAQGDPRLRLKPGRVKGRMVISLTRQPGGVQAWKVRHPWMRLWRGRSESA
jgi:hypothetical protein